MVLAAVLSAWLQYAADGKPHVRAVVSDACPTVVADQQTLAMVVRAPRSTGFADVVCDVTVPDDTKMLRVGERPLPVPAHDPRTIVVLGDTGCRISLLSVQGCNDPGGWPFPQNARAIAAVHPDLVVHVGDYLYRERGCPPLAHCTASPYGDNATTWYADFLTPAAPLFASAPLLLLRGNHEECTRNGAGWFRYFDAHSETACNDTTEPYAVDLGDLRLVTFDSSVADDTRELSKHAEVYRRQFAAVRGLAKGESWFVTHRPPYTNADERAAMDDALAPYGLVLAGHLHFFAAIDVATLPPLLVNGEGGTKLDPNYTPLLGFVMGDLHIEGQSFGSSHFGFGVYTREPKGWSISLRDPDGTERARCRLADRSVHCTAP